MKRANRCPYPPFPFPTYHPDTGTGTGYPNRTFVGLLAQPLFKQASRCLTPLHTCGLALHRSQPTTPTCADALFLHGQQAFRPLILIRAPVFLCCLLDSLTGCIPYAESGDLGAVFSTQHSRTKDTYQVQAVAVAQKRLSLGVAHA